MSEDRRSLTSGKTVTYYDYISIADDDGNGNVVSTEPPRTATIKAVDQNTLSEDGTLYTRCPK